LDIAIIYCTQGQTNPLSMFMNTSVDKSFKKFLKLMRVDHSIDTYKQTWYGFDVQWFLAPYMDEEKHRRLIGNTQCVIFFQAPAKTTYSDPELDPDNEHDQEQDKGQDMDEDPPDPFLIEKIHNLGSIAQIFFVVQPYKNKYRIGFFSRFDIIVFEPRRPENYLFDALTIREYILTKAHNGYITCMSCPPINRLYEEPRAESIRKFAKVYCPKSWLTKKTNH